MPSTSGIDKGGMQSLHGQAGKRKGVYAATAGAGRTGVTVCCCPPACVVYLTPPHVARCTGST